MSNKNILSGKYGLLEVLSEYGKDRQGFLLWECLCECGNKTILRGTSIKFGKTKSCGCLKANNSKTHGMSYSQEHRAWIAMKGRCYNKNNKKYNLYGGRGIIVCDRWLSSFENFFSDMGKKPSHKHSIDRVNNNGNYEPSNCRWATIKEQNRNTSQSLIEYNGVIKNMSDWAQQYGIPKGTFRYRHKIGLPFEQIIKSSRA